MNIPKFIGLVWSCEGQPPQIVGGDVGEDVQRETRSLFLYDKENNQLHDPEQAGWDVYEAINQSRKTGEGTGVRGEFYGPGAFEVPLKHYVVTFDQKYHSEPHPQGMHPDSFVIIEAASIDAARDFAFYLFGPLWAGLYHSTSFDPSHFPGGCVARYKIKPERAYGPDFTPSGSASVAPADSKHVEP